MSLSNYDLLVDLASWYWLVNGLFDMFNYSNWYILYVISVIPLLAIFRCNNYDSGMFLSYVGLSDISKYNRVDSNNASLIIRYFYDVNWTLDIHRNCNTLNRPTRVWIVAVFMRMWDRLSDMSVGLLMHSNSGLILIFYIAIYSYITL